MAETPQKRILVVDDDDGIRNMLSSFLVKNGFLVSSAANTVEAARLMSRNDFSAIILDWMMPGEDGATFLRRLRSAGDRTPVVMLSAKTDEIDRILGLESGADDYVPKPFSAREITARLGAIWRRMETPPPSAPVEGLFLVIGSLVLDCSDRALVASDGTKTRLSDAEFSIAKVFASNPGITLSRDRIMTLCGSGERDAFDRSVDVRVARLRKAMGDSDEYPAIKTVRGAGYVHIPAKRRDSAAQ